jgi:hypothetical protein
MQIRQIQVANDPVQDRLVLRIGTHANEEIRVFFTRRFLHELWPHLLAMLSGHLAAGPALNAPTPDNPAEPASFDQPFQDNSPTYPLGSTPILATEATLEATGPGAARMTVREARERSFNLNLNAELLQALCAMLRAASEQAHWDLALDYGKPLPLDTPAPAKPRKTLLH